MPLQGMIHVIVLEIYLLFLDDELDGVVDLLKIQDLSAGFAFNLGQQTVM